MDYEKAYKKALERARNVHKYSSDIAEIKRMEYIFSELAESEDDKIRNFISNELTCLRATTGKGSNRYEELTNAIAWLEKQSEQKSYGQREECIDCQFNYAGECKGSCTMKRSERKPADKVKPKFKISNWIINRTGATIMQIVNNEDFYESVEIGGQRRTDTYNYVERDFRLWSIEDAKDGDVLSYRDGQWIFIYKKQVDDNLFHYYSLYSTIHQDLTIDDSAFTLLDDAIIPATKEQRDLLSQKMNEAEYTFDFEKKELKN